MACELLALDGPGRRWEPKRLRLRLFSAAGRIARGGRRLRLRLAATWPWATQITGAITRLQAWSGGLRWTSPYPQSLWADLLLQPQDYGQGSGWAGLFHQARGFVRLQDYGQGSGWAGLFHQARRFVRLPNYGQRGGGPRHLLSRECRRGGRVLHCLLLEGESQQLSWSYCS